MKLIQMAHAGALCVLFAAGVDVASAANRPSPCHSTAIQVNGHGLWVDYTQRRNPTLVFEAGGGNDSTVWTDFLGKIRHFGLSTFVYDRAGLGNSDVDPSPYSIEREVDALDSALRICKVHGDLILIAHSYGGNIALLTAAKNSDVKGVILLDAVVPGYNNASRVQRVLETYRPQYAEVRDKAPKLAAAVIPMMEAYPETAKSLDAAAIPPRLPIIDIVAEKPAEDTPLDMADWYAAHRAFVQASKARSYVFATGSGHKVILDRPDLVLQAIGDMLGKIKTGAH